MPHLLTALLSGFFSAFSNLLRQEKSFSRGEVCLCRQGLGHAFDHHTGCCLGSVMEMSDAWGGSGQKRNEPNITFWFEMLQKNLGINLCNAEIINRCFYD